MDEGRIANRRRWQRERTLDMREGVMGEGEQAKGFSDGNERREGEVGGKSGRGGGEL